MIASLLIANRGEIACRIIRTARRLSIAALLLAVPAAAPAAPPGEGLVNASPDLGAENIAVIERVRALFAALRAGDGAGALRHVYPDGRVTALEQIRDGASTVHQMSWAQFAARARPETTLWDQSHDPMILVAGDFAIAWIPFDTRVAGRIVECGLNHFDLVRETGVWKVMNLTFSSRAASCPAR